MRKNFDQHRSKKGINYGKRQSREIGSNSSDRSTGKEDSSDLLLNVNPFTSSIRRERRKKLEQEKLEQRAEQEEVSIETSSETSGDGQDVQYRPLYSTLRFFLGERMANKIYGVN